MSIAATRSPACAAIISTAIFVAAGCAASASPTAARSITANGRSAVWGRSHRSVWTPRASFTSSRATAACIGWSRSRRAEAGRLSAFCMGYCSLHGVETLSHGHRGNLIASATMPSMLFAFVLNTSAAAAAEHRAQADLAAITEHDDVDFITRPIRVQRVRERLQIFHVMRAEADEDVAFAQSGDVAR